jgi:hypothetical protein
LEDRQTSPASEVTPARGQSAAARRADATQSLGEDDVFRFFLCGRADKSICGAGRALDRELSREPSPGRHVLVFLPLLDQTHYLRCLVF